MQPQIEKVLTTTDHKIQRIADQAQSKVRALAVRERAKLYPGWRKVFVKRYPDYQNRARYKRLDNVLLGRTTDAEMLAQIIEILDELEHHQKQVAA